MRGARRRLVRAAAAALAGAWAASPAAAADLEKLVMPGPLIQGHADIEAECGRCHTAFQRDVESRLCADCHKDVAADEQRHEGFHGRAPGAAQAACRDCHGDHRGRDADVSGLDPHTFDHELTDYPLHGAHRALACASCHEPGKKHREAPGTCLGCHRDDDPHRGRLGEDCGACHSESAWSGGRFDHAKTDFPLLGKHQDVACGLCHPSERYAETPTACAACHATDDVHRGSFGSRCESCHSAAAWKEEKRFDHDRETRFPLEGRHAAVACSACHASGAEAKDAPTACIGCHRDDDAHHGRYGEKCETCHGAKDWSAARFDHDRDTDFPLRGAHRSAACETCHRGALYTERAERDCIGCHADDDVHRGQEGKDCERCHAEASWRPARFDHELTRFPLLGLHAAVPCEACHATPAYRDAKLECAACHADDFHRGRLGTDCALCHNPNGWKVWRFDHDATSFALHGAHQGVDCHACHSQPVEREIRLASDCASCHARDDVHRGAFGASCERCHGESSWKDALAPR